MNDGLRRLFADLIGQRDKALLSALTTLKTPSKPTHRVRAPTPLGWDAHGFVGFAGVRVSMNERRHRGPWSGEIESGLRRSQNPKMSIEHDLAAVVSINGEITVDARLIAPHLGQSWPALSGQVLALDKWSLCRFPFWCADVGASRREGVARLE
jgi:hypothetical protein